MSAAPTLAPPSPKRRSGLSPIAPPAPSPAPLIRTAAELAERFGDVPLSRIVLDPEPGTATVEDMDRVKRETGRVCELIDGTLIEKAVSADSDLMGMKLGQLLLNAIGGRKLGWVLGAQAFLRLSGSRLRAADVTFVSKRQVPGGVFPGPSTGGLAYPDLYPDLAVEVLSPNNTRAEMRRKREDFFNAGTVLVWQIDPARGECEVYTRPEEPDATIPADGALDGGEVLPNVSIPLADVLAAVELN